MRTIWEPMTKLVSILISAWGCLIFSISNPELFIHLPIFLIEEAVNDHHFKVREIFSNKIVNNLGEEIPALPIPVDKQFRKEKVSISSMIYF